MLVVGGLLLTTISPAPAQVVIGERPQPGVVVNSGVLERLGREPTLPDLYSRAAGRPPLIEPQGLSDETRPFRPGAGRTAIHRPRHRKTKTATAPHRGPAAKVAKAAGKTAAGRPATASSGAVTFAPNPTVGLPAPPRIAEPPKPLAPAKAAKAEPPKSEPVKPVEVAKPEPAKPPSPVVAKAEPPKPEPVKPVEGAKPEPAKAPSPVVAKAEPPKAVSPLEPPKPAVIAALPPPMPPARKGDSLTLPFALDSSNLSESTRAALEKLAQRMQQDEQAWLQVQAYAAGDEANASKARRLSLSRALEVRKFLMEMGVPSTRIEVRALGNKVESGPADRVDAVLLRR